MYEELVNGPDTRIADSPISCLAEQLAVGPMGFDWDARRSDIMWTSRQANCACTGTASSQQGRRAHKNTFFRDVPGSSWLSVPLVCPFICLVEPLAGP